MKKTWLLILSLSVAGAVDAAAVDAKRLWDRHCAICHGPDGKGQTTMGKRQKVKDYTDAKVQAEMKDPAMFKAIKEGVQVPGSVGMKGFGDALSDAEIRALVDYIRKFKK